MRKAIYWALVAVFFLIGGFHDLVIGPTSTSLGAFAVALVAVGWARHHLRSARPALTPVRGYQSSWVVGSGLEFLALEGGSAGSSLMVQGRPTDQKPVTYHFPFCLTNGTMNGVDELALTAWV